jgi:hypothetical protein
MRDRLGGRFVSGYIRLEDRLEPKRLRLSLSLALVAAVAAGALTAKGLDFPSAHFWARSGAKALLVGAVFAQLVGTAVLIADYRNLVRSQSAKDVLAEACKTLATFVAEKLAIQPDEVGVHVWEIRGVWPVRYLSRIARSHPMRSETAIDWRKGVGAIGRCWKECEDTLADVGDLIDIDEATFEALPRRNRFNLRWRDFDRLKRYPTVLALRLHGDLRGARAIAGVLSVDLKVPGRKDDLKSLYDQHLDREIGAVLAVCNDALGNS